MKKIKLKFKMLFVIIIVLIITFFVRITDIETSEMKYHSKEEVIYRVYPVSLSRISVYSYIRNNILHAKHSAPNIENIVVKFINPFKVKLEVYEKPIVGYIRFQNEYYYFDEDLYILEKRESRDDRYIEISGINIIKKDVDSYLDIDNKNASFIIKNVAKNSSAMEIHIDSINFTKTNAIEIVGEGLCVNIGDGSHIEEKISLIVDMYPKLKGMEGTLDLSKVKTGKDKGEYIFKKR